MGALREIKSVKKTVRYLCRPISRLLTALHLEQIALLELLFLSLQDSPDVRYACFKYKQLSDLTKFLTLDRPSFTINVLGTGQEISHTLETSSTIGALKAAVNAQLTNPGNLAFDLFQNGQALRNESQSLSSAGVRHDQPILLIFNMGSTALQTSRLSAARQPRSGAATGDENEIERLRQATLSNNDAQARLRTEVPELHAALSDPARFREQFRLHRDRRQQEQQERSRMLSELEANPEDPDNQRKILDMIQQQNIEAQFNEVWEKYPERKLSYFAVRLY